MAKPWEYPPWRHAAMQGIMWITLLGTVGLALLTDNDLRRAMRLELGPEISDGPMQFSLPKGWQTQSETRPGLWSHEATEPGEGNYARTVTISRQRVDGMPQPFEYLLATDLDLRTLFNQSGEQVFDPKSVVISGWPGLRLTVEATRTDADGNRTSFKALIACVILSDGQAIEIEVQGQGSVDGRDEELLHEEIDSMKLSAPPPTAGGEVAVSDAASLTAPHSFLVIPSLDPNRTDRLLIDNTVPGQWMSVDLIPWIRLPDQSPQAVEQLLLARDVQSGVVDPGAMDWLSATLAVEKPLQENLSQWRLDPAAGPATDATVARRAYVLADPSGQAMLIVFRVRGADGSGRIDRAWAQLAGAIRFDSPIDLAALLTEGGDQARLIRSNGLSQFLGLQPRRAFWLASDPSPEGTTTIYEYGLASGGRRVVKHLGIDRSVIIADQSWTASSDLTTFTSQITGGDYPQGADHPTENFTQAFEADGSKLQTKITWHNGSGAGHVIQLPQFLPSGILPAALAQIAQRPMILQTDQFPGFATNPAPYPLTLLIRPIPPPADGGDSQAALGVEVEVSGSGAESRWFFQADGSLDHAELPAALRLTPSSQAEIQSRFADDIRLTNPLR